MLSFRTRILLIVLMLGTVPPALLGLWLTGSTARAGDEIVSSRVEAAAEEATVTLVSRWIRLRSRILDLVDDARVQAVMEGSSPVDETGLEAAVDLLGFRPLRLDLRDLEGRLIWTLEEPAKSQFRPPGLSLGFPVRDRQSDRILGRMEVEVGGSTLLPGDSQPEGMLVGLFNGVTGLSLIPRAFDRSLTSEDRFVWSGEEWVARRHVLDEPPVTLAVAAPVNPFGDLFTRKARTGLWLLMIVSSVGFLLATLVTSRLTHSLRELSAVARDVAGGHLDQQVEAEGPDEVREVAGAFNSMMRSLRRTLEELSTRESLAAVGEFAASLAHEVRNPLTAVRVDLERVEEGLDDDSPLRTAQERALREIVRLDETVSRALRSARHRTFRPGVVDLRDPVAAAAAAAKPSFEERKAFVDTTEASSPMAVRGDPDALEQLFLNVLRNAAQALDEGGRARVSMARRADEVIVEVRDNGGGVPADAVGRVFEPMYSTRDEGTGLGLTIAQRIATAHGGRLEFESEEGVGSTVRLRLPVVPAAVV